MASPEPSGGISGSTSAVCAVCKRPHSDLSLIGCGCTFHVTCLPLSVILDPNSGGLAGGDGVGTIPIGPRQSQGMRCEVCQGGINGIHIFPLSFEPLQKSIELRKAAALAPKRFPISSNESAGSSNNNSDTYSGGIKRGRDNVVDLDVEATHVVFSQGKKTLSTSLKDSESHRTGRWMDEEVAYTDHLVNSFNQGRLPLPHGTRLSSFLGDMLLCKASRLTKKMKNAKLSARTFEIQPGVVLEGLNPGDSEVLTSLQENFVAHMPSEYSQLELRFNIMKHWRAYFSNLCVQVGYPFLDGALYMESVEEYERISSNSDERMRNVRRRRMGFNLRPDSKNLGNIRATPLLGLSAGAVVNAQPLPESGTSSVTTNITLLDKPTTRTELRGSQPAQTVPLHDDFESSFMDIMGPVERDGDSAFHEIAGDSSLIGLDRVKERRDPFLEAIAMYLEKYNLPFQHADVWVPSFVADKDSESGEGVRLLPGGHVTRRDQDGVSWSAYESFGEYSKSFSFVPGKGLVGRVYATGKTLWEFEVSELDPEVFLRADGAKEYGIRTATGIPFSTPGVGRMVVVLYSCNYIQEDESLAHRCAQELASYCPEPKWKLVIEVGDSCNLEALSAPAVHHTTMADEVFKPRNSQGRQTPNNGEVCAHEISPLSNQESNEDDVQNIISLLGDELAFSSSSGSTEDAPLFNEFMSMRLMLLRPASRRSAEENEVIEVLKNSYKAYSGGNTRSGNELATLLAREWLCLSGSSSKGAATSAPAAPPSLPQTFGMQQLHKVHQVHAMYQSMPHSELGGMGMHGPPVQLPTRSSKLPSPPKEEDRTIMVHDHSKQNYLTSLSEEKNQISTPPLPPIAPPLNLPAKMLRRTVSASTVGPSSGASSTATQQSGSFILNPV